MDCKVRGIKEEVVCRSIPVKSVEGRSFPKSETLAKEDGKCITIVTFLPIIFRCYPPSAMSFVLLIDIDISEGFI